MEIGKIIARGQNVNLLHEALHPEHGLVWTDGKAILKAPVKFYNGQVENVEPQKLGEFEHSVRSVHWSSDIGPHLCYLCVVHEQQISLWKVDSKSSKLEFKQVRKLNLQPIPQGCLWNPGRDILCVLSKQQCSFFFKHAQKKGSYAFPPVESGKINCGTWSRDGSSLIVCVGGVLLVYTWSDIDSSISSVTPSSWKIPGLDSCVNSIVSLPNNMVVCAVELPLESLCKEQNMFDTPDIPDNNNVDIENKDNSDEIISPKSNHTSLTDTLLNLPRNSQNDIKDTSQLIAVRLIENKEPTKVFDTGITGLLTPDVLYFEESLNAVIAGSNNQGLLQVFTVSQTGFVKSNEIQLDNTDRPKGISGFVGYDGQNSGVLLAIGRKSGTDSALPPSASGTPMDIVVKFYPVSTNINVKKVEEDEKEGSNGVPQLALMQNIESGSAESSPRLSGDLSSLRYSNEQTESDSGNSYLMKERKLSSSSSNLDSPRETTVQAPPRQKKKTHNKESSDSGSEISKEITPLPESDVEKKIVDLDKSVSSDDLETEIKREITLLPKSDGEKKIVDLDKFASSDDLETETTSFSDSKPKFANSDVTKFFDEQSADTELIQDIASKSEQEPSADEIVKRNLELSESNEVNYTDLQDELQKQDEKIEALKNRIEQLCKTVDETPLVFPNKYQDMEKPDLVKVICQYEGDNTLKKKFVLDNGRLKLDLIKQAFDLEVVELYIEGDPCVVGSNIDGYLPIRFQPSSTLVITGKHVTVETGKDAIHPDTTC